MTFVEKASLIVLGVILVAIAALLLGVLKIFPKYSPGEATALVKASYATDATRSFAEEYLGRGIWEVRGGANQQVHFRVYEQTDTVETIDERGSVPVVLSSRHSNAPYFIALVGNAVVFVAHVIFAVIFWSKMRRIRATQT